VEIPHNVHDLLLLDKHPTSGYKTRYLISIKYLNLSRRSRCFVLFLLIYPRLKARQLLVQFNGAIAMDRRLSGAPSGTSQRDLLNWSNGWMKSIALQRHFLLTLCCCRQKVSRTARMLCEKSHADAARDGGKRIRMLLFLKKQKHASRLKDQHTE
jgi:hypothetical protein